MIGIINVTEDRTNGTYGEGVQLYVVQINQQELFTFRHIFEDGLSGCLKRATKAALEYEDIMEERRIVEESAEQAECDKVDIKCMEDTEEIMEECVTTVINNLQSKIEEALSILSLYNETQEQFKKTKEEIDMRNKKCCGGGKKKK